MISSNEIDIMDELFCVISTSVYKNLYFVRKGFAQRCLFYNKFLNFLGPRKSSIY